jgi:hypothetical protein
LRARTAPGLPPGCRGFALSSSARSVRAVQQGHHADRHPSTCHIADCEQADRQRTTRPPGRPSAPTHPERLSRAHRRAHSPAFYGQAERGEINSAGERVDRYIIDDAEDLLAVAEHFGIGQLSHDKDDYYSGQLPDGRYRKIEWNLKGHPNTNEGPHVKVMETEDSSSPPSRGNRWKTKAMIFVEGHEQFKRQWH